jgi:rare lipoprotein A
MYDMTAAHRTLPFGMQVKVHDLENGRDVTVRINDRGPFVEGRIIDLSYAAAQAMGMNGIARVRLELLGMAPVPVPASVPGTVPTPEPSAIPVPGPAPIPVPAPAAIPAPSITTPTAIPSEVPGIFAVQVGSFSDLNNANRLKALIESSFTPVTVQSFDRGNGIVYRVQVGREATEARAEALAEKLRDSNLTNTTFVVRVN